MNKLISVGLLALSFCTVLNALPSGFRLREGDIMEPIDRSVSIQTRQWTNGIVYYNINNGYSSSTRNLILDSMNLITNKTSGCITFVQRTNQNNYIDIASRGGCYSYLGMLGGAQPLSLSNGCYYRGTIVHELMHALGYNHEQNRNDRDQYVTINLSNVDADKTNNFEKTRNGNYHNTPYDYASIMHYGEYSFSNNGQRTIIPKNGNTIKEPYNKNSYQEAMTDFDVSSVRDRYQCAAVACVNELSFCNNYADQKDLYCDRGTYDGRPFNEVCRQLCNNCGTGVTTQAPVTQPPATQPPATQPPVTQPPTCTNDSPSCSLYVNFADQLCPNTNVLLNNLPLNIACRQLCNNCGSGVTTQAPVTQPPATQPPTCTNDSPSCSLYVNFADQLCPNPNVLLNNLPLNIACRQLCNNCGSNTCVNIPSCSLITLSEIYCRTTNIYTFEGIPFRQACPVYCNSCGEV